MKNKTKVLHIRVSEDDYENIKCKAKKFNFKNLSEYLRYVGLSTSEIKIVTKEIDDEE